jgi:malate dehydrogenase (oxaloacetate-decarboxylating)
MGTAALDLHKKYKGKIKVESKVTIETKQDLSLAYTPGVAEACREIAEDVSRVFEYTSKGNLVAVVTDGSAVLGLGNIGPEASLPVMEGKAILFKKFGNVDAFPICLKTQDAEEIIKVVKLLEPTFGGINLEDISAPRCFEIEERLRTEMSIPVFHDDQHGTAIVVLAGLINASKVVGKDITRLKVVISGAGAAGMAIAKLLLNFGIKDIILCDSGGAIYEGRAELNPFKQNIAKVTNRWLVKGSIREAIKLADAFIGVSQPNLVGSDMVKTMNEKAIIFAMANPVPEIFPEEAKNGGAAVIATGRSDFPNQVNNVLAFPGVFRGVLDIRAIKITDKMKIAAAQAIAGFVKDPNPEKIVPSVFEEGVAQAVAEAVKVSARL